MSVTTKKSTRRSSRFTPASLQDHLDKIQSGWQTCDRHERAILAQARQLQLCKLAGLCGG